MITKKYSYNEFTSVIDNKILRITEKIDELNKSIDVITNFKPIKDARVSLILSKILNNKITDNRFIELDITLDNKILIESYLKSIIKMKKEISLLEVDLKRYNAVKMSSNDFVHLMNTINFEAAKAVLRNERYNVGNSLGILLVTVKNRYFGTKYNNKVVNWKESLDQLFFIAETTNKETKELKSRYDAKLIRKKEFIDKMKPYVWSSDNTDLPKWLIYYTDDTSVWWHWIKKYSNIPNQSLYCFEPTNYINILNEKGQRSQLSVASTLTEDEIINSTNLGNRDKMNCLFNKDKSYFIHKDTIS